GAVEEAAPGRWWGASGLRHEPLATPASPCLTVLSAAFSPGCFPSGLLERGFALPGRATFVSRDQSSQKRLPLNPSRRVAPGSFAPSLLRGAGIDGPSMARQCLSPHPCGSPLYATIALSRIERGGSR